MSKLELHQFYGFYANVPLEDRLVVLDFYGHGNQTLTDVYKEIDRLNSEVMERTLEINAQIEWVEDYVLEHQARDTDLKPSDLEANTKVTLSRKEK